MEVVTSDFSIHTPVIKIKLNDSILNETNRGAHQLYKNSSTTLKTRYLSPINQIANPYEIEKKVLKITNFVPYKDLDEINNVRDF